MKKTVIKYGIYGAIAICGLFLVSWFVLDDLPLSTQEALGYLSMILSLSFVFFGIKHYRDKENEGKVSFKNALVIGLLISLITALVFGVLDVIYTEVLNPDFMDTYYSQTLKTMEETMPAEEFEVKKAEMDAQKELFANPLMTFLFMALTVFVIGFIVSLLSALILQRK
ncbi:DUF4199 domain-containing protein [Flagellimonas meridianipacifica]|uniref:Uncharacterized protein DUF4199 n=1 Tax=Flagellimonas meridianipacifica TaxID=1080225 RepID=A0A2T0MIC0_9FLAO|nr:DUF4199 domain-containing protein [Allomuricauda pacifica]PRX57332.1 uncharacterized protein DUF4199 [Allomuricauda pacifica]